MEKNEWKELAEDLALPTPSFSGQFFSLSFRQNCDTQGMILSSHTNNRFLPELHQLCLVGIVG
jgi:hypothetical protein